MTDEVMQLYQRLQQIYMLMNDEDRRNLSVAEISSSQYHLLLQLPIDSTEPGLTLGDLAERLHCTPSNATRLVQRLELQGLVQLTRDTKDRRMVFVTLTEAGRETLAAARTAHETPLAHRFDALTPDELQSLSALTEKLILALQSESEE